MMGGVSRSFCTRMIIRQGFIGVPGIIVIAAVVLNT